METEGERFGRRFKEERLRREKTQGWVLARLGDLGYRPMTQPTLTRIERGEREPRLTEAVGLAYTLRVRPERLYESWEDHQVRDMEDRDQEGIDAFDREQRKNPDHNKEDQ